ncbi:pyocin knob domain-containing protein [Devosia sp. A449]
MSIFFPNNAGAVRFNSGSATINGTGTLFKSYRAGSTISIPGVGSMQLAADPTSDTVATGSVIWGSTTTAFQAFEYHARNEEGVFSDTFVQLLNELRSGIIPALAALDGAGGDKLIKLTGAGTAEAFAAKNLIAMAGLDGADGDKGVMLTGAGTAATFGLTAAMRELANDPDFATMRATLSLVLQSSLTDATAGRVLTAGSFGLGNSTQLTNLNTAPHGFFFCGASSTGAPASGADFHGYTSRASNTSAATQIAQQIGGGIYIRTFVGGTWGVWKRLDLVTATTANGTYFQLPSGLLLCLRFVNVNLTITTSQAFAMPASFVGGLCFGGATLIGVSSGTTFTAMASHSLRTAGNSWDFKVETAGSTTSEQIALFSLGQAA